MTKKKNVVLRVLNLIFLVAFFASIWSAYCGFRTVFFPGAALVAFLVSVLVQGTEVLFARELSVAGCLAFVLSVWFSSLSFIDAASPAAKYRTAMEHSLSSRYTTELLPDLQADVAAQLEQLSGALYSQLDVLKSSTAPQEAGQGGESDVFEAVRGKFTEAQKADPLYLDLESAMSCLETGQTQQAADILQTLLRMTGTTSMEKKVRKYAEFLQNRMTASYDDTIRTTAHAIEKMLSQGSVSVSELTAAGDELIAAVLDSEQEDVEMEGIAQLWEDLSQYAGLVRLNTDLAARAEKQPEFAGEINAAGADEDADTALAKVKALWKEELSTLRAEVASSALPGRAQRMKEIDWLMRYILAFFFSFRE